jgi:hypothetical protein
MPAKLELTEDGFLDLTIGQVTKRVDLWYVYNSILQNRTETADTEYPVREYLARTVKLLDELGFPNCSCKTASEFTSAIQAMIEEQAKKNRHQHRQTCQVLRCRNPRRPRRREAVVTRVHRPPEARRVFREWQS